MALLRARGLRIVQWFTAGGVVSFLRAPRVMAACVPPPRVPNRDKLLSEFVVAFDAGSGDAFFKLWDRHVSVGKGSDDYKRLDFYLHVHFAVFPFRAQLASPDKDGSDACGGSGSGTPPSYLQVRLWLCVSSLKLSACPPHPGPMARTRLWSPCASSRPHPLHYRLNRTFKSIWTPVVVSSP